MREELIMFMEANGCQKEEEIIVYSTRNYDLFSYDKKNNRRVRIDTRDFSELVADIQERGLYEPITVIRDEGKEVRFIVTAGQHRLEACKLLKIPVKFIIISREDYSPLLQMHLDNKRRKNIFGEYIEMGAERGHEVFRLIMRVFNDFHDEFNGTISALFETVFTVCVNKKARVYTNSSFARLCRKGPEVANREIDRFSNWVVYDDEVNEIYDFIRTVSGISRVIDKSHVTVNFNKEFLKLLTPNKDVEITPQEVLNFLENEENASYRENLRNASKGSGSEIKVVLKKIQEEALASAEIQKRAKNRRNIKTVKKEIKDTTERVKKAKDAENNKSEYNKE